MRLIAPQFVKPYRKSNKNDAAGAEAICVFRLSEVGVGTTSAAFYAARRLRERRRVPQPKFSRVLRHRRLAINLIGTPRPS